MKNKWLLLVLLVVIAALAIKYFRVNGNHSANSITLAENITPVSAPVTIARINNYFKDEQLTCQTKPFASGRLALDALIGGQADFATVAETPIVLASMQGQPITVIATFTSSEKNTKILARSDKGIKSPQDLNGKRIAITFGSNGAYYLDVFLRDNTIAQKNVDLVNLSPPDMAAALSRGDVDAICTWEPHILNGKKTLDSNVIVFQNKLGRYTQTFNIVARKEFIEKHPKEVNAFLKSLLSAEKFIREHKQDAIAIVAKENKMSRDDLQTIWADYDFSLSLNNQLVNALEGQSQWALRMNLAAPETLLPPISQLITSAPLNALKPASVTLGEK